MKTLNQLYTDNGWDNKAISDLLPAHPAVSTVNKWHLPANDLHITDNDLLLLNFIDKYGELV